MSMRQQSVVGLPKAQTRVRNGVLYGWLLIALFNEYARPPNQFSFLDFPFIYSIVPLSLLLVSMFASGLRPMSEIFADKLAKWVLILFGLVVISIPFASVSAYALSTATMLLGYVIFFLLVARIVITEKRLRGVIIALMMAHLYLLAVNFNVLTNPQQRQYLVGGTFLGDGNDFALSLCILVPCLVEIALNMRKALGKALAWGATAVAALAIIASQSRGGTLGLAAVLLYIWWRSPRRMVAMLGIAMLGVLMLIYAPPQYFERMSTVSIANLDGSAQGRVNAWKRAIGMGVKSPILGVGAGQFGPMWGQTAHSTYMLAFGELGFPGFICVIILVFGNLRANARLRGRLLARAGPEPSEDILRTTRLLDLLNAAMVGFAVAGAFLSATYYPHMFVLTALLISARIFASRQAGLTSFKQA